MLCLYKQRLNEPRAKQVLELNMHAYGDKTRGKQYVAQDGADKILGEGSEEEEIPGCMKDEWDLGKNEQDMEIRKCREEPL